MYCVWVKERSKRMVHLSGVLSRAFNVRMRWDTNEINEAVYRIMSKQRGDQLNTFYFLLINKRWPINSDSVCNFWYFLVLVFFFVWWSDSINIEKIKRNNKKRFKNANRLQNRALITSYAWRTLLFSDNNTDLYCNWQT